MFNWYAIYSAHEQSPELQFRGFVWMSDQTAAQLRGLLRDAYVYGPIAS